ncbi:MAG: RHS repeat-associated core domain-containing protein, partial [Candidatus Omnitrophota bacterium]|nr:RHS repeat-associated core domain-containing protein [Candidatus Omnitrophota bacterium]
MNNRNFLTKQTDSTGLIFFGARYYDPRLGRFISADPSGMSDGPNLYVYCSSSPINLIDPWGLCGENVNNQLPPWALVAGSITIATPIPGDEIVFWTIAGYTVYQATHGP